jgi:hypothetical protein
VLAVVVVVVVVVVGVVAVVVVGVDDFVVGDVGVLVVGVGVVVFVVLADAVVVHPRSLPCVGLGLRRRRVPPACARFRHRGPLAIPVLFGRPSLLLPPLSDLTRGAASCVCAVCRASPR